MSKVSVILNLYNRPNSLEVQYQSVLEQTVKPAEILIFMNKGADVSQFNPRILAECKTTISNANWGVHARIAHSLNTTSPYVMLLDDDVRVGKRWIEQCLEIQESEKCVLGTIGIISRDLQYCNYERVGWANPNETLTQVDFVGHNWVFPREVAAEYWRGGYIPWSPICGEDIGLSFAAQRLGMKTYVPPHYSCNTDFWGSLPEEAWSWGTEAHCISRNYHQSHFGRALQDHYNRGFKFLNIS